MNYLNINLDATNLTNPQEITEGVLVGIILRCKLEDNKRIAELSEQLTHLEQSIFASLNFIDRAELVTCSPLAVPI